MQSTTNRRHFIQQSGAATLATLGIGVWSSRAAAASTSPNEKLRIALVGADGQANFHIDSITFLGQDCPCYCDVDTARQGRAAETWPLATAYQDYRKMFDKEHKNIDAVIIVVPDHHHYPAAMIAMQLGKHVYCEKPLTHSIWEARQLTLMARKQKLATQMGNQGHSMIPWRQFVTMIRAGHIGDVREVHVWSDRPIWPQGIDRPKETPAVPSTLDWDVWLGPAPERPYNPAYHPFSWRGWWDFGTGALGDMACHHFDGMFWALEPDPPTSCEVVTNSVLHKETYPERSIIRWQFPAKKERPAFTAYWYDGGLLPPRPADLEPERHLPTTGCYFVGTKGTLMAADWYGYQPQLLPAARMQEVKLPEKLAILPSPGHHQEFIDACKGGPPAGSNFDYAGPMTEALLLGNLAIALGKPIEWDSDKLSAKGLPDAERLIHVPHRKGWDIQA